MMTEEGRVLAIEEDGLWVETQKQSVCNQCSAQKGCGQALLAKSVMTNMSCVKARFSSPSKRIWQVGDAVQIGIEESALMKAAFVSYVLPLITMLLGVLLASLVSDGDVLAAIGATFGLCVGFGFSKFHASRLKNAQTYHALVME